MGELEVMVLLVSATVGTGIMSLPVDIVTAAGRDAWLSTVLALGLVLLPAVATAHVAARFPGHTLTQFLEHNWGKAAARGTAAAFAAHFVFLGAVALRSAGDQIKTILLPRTPLEIIVLALLLVAVYVAREGLAPIARMLTILFFVLPLPFVLLALSLKSATFDNVLPVLFDGPGPVLRGTAQTLFAFGGIEGLFVWVPAMRRPERAVRTAVYGLLIVGVIYLWTVWVTQVVFTPEQIVHMQLPIKAAIDTIDLPLVIFERLDVVLYSVWLTAAFTTILVLLHLASRFLQDLFGFRTETPLVLPLVPVMFTLALIPDDALSVARWADAAAVSEACLAIGFPLALWLVMRRR